VLRLLGLQRGAEQLVCHCLADLADRVQRRGGVALTPGADELRAARDRFGLGPREARERARMGRALRQLPAIERALVDGDLSYSRVREITRVASAATEVEWLELAGRLDMRSLERRVAGTLAAASDARASQPVGMTRRVTFELSEQACELLDRALENARRAGGAHWTDGEALARVARVALSAQGAPIDLDPVAQAGGALTASLTTASRSPATASRGKSASPRAVGGTGATSTALKPVRPWSWDDLGWGDQGGAPNEQNHARGAGQARQTMQGRCGQAAGDPLSLDAVGPSIEGTAERSGDEREGVSAADGAWWTGTESDESAQNGGGFERDEWGEINSRLLRAMGDGGRWDADRLIEASGLSAREVNTALTLLQLGGRIRRREDAFEVV